MSVVVLGDATREECHDEWRLVDLCLNVFFDDFDAELFASFLAFECGFDALFIDFAQAIEIIDEIGCVEQDIEPGAGVFGEQVEEFISGLSQVAFALAGELGGDGLLFALQFVDLFVDFGIQVKVTNAEDGLCFFAQEWIAQAARFGVEEPFEELNGAAIVSCAVDIACLLEFLGRGLGLCGQWPTDEQEQQKEGA